MSFLDYTGLTSFWNKVKDILAGKQNLLTVGEGISLENNALSLLEPVKGVTKEQYDALSDEKKNAGLYVITDANINLSNCGDFYAVEETRIGTWIDGKPLYRRVITGTTGEMGTFFRFFEAKNLSLKNGYGIIIRTDGITAAIPDMKASVLYDTSGVVIYVSAEVYARCPIELVLEYTKTTDQVTAVSSVSTQSLSINSSDSISQSSEKVLSSKVPLPSTATYVPASSVSTAIGFIPASAVSAKL